jgi:hypothetical protein
LHSIVIGFIAGFVVVAFTLKVAFIKVEFIKVILINLRFIVGSMDLEREGSLLLI